MAEDATLELERVYVALAERMRALRQNGELTESAEHELRTQQMASLAALTELPPPDDLTPLSASSSSLPPITEIHAISDLHFDQPLPSRCKCAAGCRTPMDWLRALGASPPAPSSSLSPSSSSPPSPSLPCHLSAFSFAFAEPAAAVAVAAAIVVAGDVADSFSATLTALAELKRRYTRVFWLPGNHELFLRGDDARAFPDSWCKLFARRQACARLGIETSPALVTPSVVVAPLLSWYDGGAFFAGTDDPAASSSSSSLRFDAPCDWGPVCEKDVHRVMLSLGKRQLATARAAASGRGDGASVLITATHFLPRRDLPFHGGIMQQAMGCVALGAAVLPALGAAVLGGGGGGDGPGRQQRQQHIHVYGHSHVNVDRDDLGDSVRYVQHSLAGGGGRGGGTRSSLLAGGASSSSSAATASSAPRSCDCFKPLCLWRAPDNQTS